MNPKCPPSLSESHSVGPLAILGLLCRLGLAAIFLYAGVPKVLNAQVFLMETRAYQMLPNSILPSFVVILAMIEVLAGALLLLGVWIRPSANVILGMLIMFVVAISVAMLRGLDIECGCFSGGGQKIGFQLLVRDAIMIAMLIPIYLDRRHLLALWAK